MAKRLLIHSCNEMQKYVQNLMPEEYGGDYISRRKYLLFSKNGLFSRIMGLRDINPCFFDRSVTNHNLDLRNIEAARRNAGVMKEDLSVVVFDYHTDMYDTSGDNWRWADKEGTNMGSWVNNLFEEGYSDVSLVGVVDISRTGKEEERRLFRYGDFREKLSIYTSPEFNPERDMPTKNVWGLDIKPLAEFPKKKLRKYTYVSLDCDVSNSFADQITDHESFFYGVRGKIGIDELERMIQSIPKVSNVIGLSMFFLWGGIKREYDDNVRRVLKAAF